MIQSSTKSRQPKRQPWTCERLLHKRAIALGYAIDSSTWKTYGSALNSYFEFTKSHHFPLEPTPLDPYPSLPFTCATTSNLTLLTPTSLVSVNNWKLISLMFATKGNRLWSNAHYVGANGSRGHPQLGSVPLHWMTLMWYSPTTRHILLHMTISSSSPCYSQLFSLLCGSVN